MIPHWNFKISEELDQREPFGFPREMSQISITRTCLEGKRPLLT